MEELRNEVNNEMETIETETTDLLPVDDYSYEVDTKVDVSSMLIGGAIVAAVGGTIAITKFIKKKIKDHKAKKEVDEIEDELVEDVEVVEGEVVEDEEETSEKKSKKK